MAHGVCLGAAELVTGHVIGSGSRDSVNALPELGVVVVDMGNTWGVDMAWDSWRCEYVCGARKG